VSTALTAFELVVGLVVLQRLAELVHSRRNLARLSAASRTSDSRGNWRALVALQSSWLAGCVLEPALRGRVAPSGLFWGGACLFLSGECLRTWCIVVLGRSWNARGRVDPTLRVVSTGPYRWIRHPNYLGVLLEVVGLPLAGGAFLTLAVALPLHAWVLARRMRGEDELLFALPGYAEQMGAKGALFPRLARR
jgi:methyltransferase